MDRNKHQPEPAAPQTTQPNDTHTARNLQAGLTLVPYYAYNERGERVAFCTWVRLRPGESIANAAARLSVPAPEPAWTPELKAHVEGVLKALISRE